MVLTMFNANVFLLPPLLTNFVEKYNGMNKLSVLFFGISLFIYACNGTGLGQTSPDRPPKLIGRDTMIYIMTEIHLAESGIGMMGIDYNRATALYQKYHQNILQKFKTDTAQYRQSYEYYMQSPLEMEYILTLVEDSLVRVQASEKQKMGISATPSYQDMFPQSGTKSQDTTKKVQ